MGNLLASLLGLALYYMLRRLLMSMELSQMATTLWSWIATSALLIGVGYLLADHFTPGDLLGLLLLAGGFAVVIHIVVKIKERDADDS